MEQQSDRALQERRRLRELRRRKRRREAIRNRILALLLLAALIAAGILLLRGCANRRKAADDVPAQTPVQEPSQAAAPSSAQPRTQPEQDILLTLVNPWNKLPADWKVDLVTVDGAEVDRRCAADLEKMLRDCRAAGLDPLICSAYRSYEYQQRLYENKQARLRENGMSREAAALQAGREVAAPGTSEHQLGWTVDIVDVSYQILDDAQENTPAQKWLMANSWRYGFIHRYPTGKSDVTGIIYEPWHYRYVGRDAAREMYRKNLTLEEYLQQ